MGSIKRLPLNLRFARHRDSRSASIRSRIGVASTEVEAEAEAEGHEERSWRQLGTPEYQLLWPWQGQGQGQAESGAADEAAYEAAFGRYCDRIERWCGYCPASTSTSTSTSICLAHSSPRPAVPGTTGHTVMNGADDLTMAPCREPVRPGPADRLYHLWTPATGQYSARSHVFTSTRKSNRRGESSGLEHCGAGAPPAVMARAGVLRFWPRDTGAHSVTPHSAEGPGRRSRR